MVFVGVTFTLKRRICSNDYTVNLGNQLRPMIQHLFPQHNDIFHNDNASGIVKL